MKQGKDEPKVSLREVNLAARRQRILDAARTLLAEGGAEALSMRKLAREAQLSVTTLYNLVGSRDEILEALIEDSAERVGSTAEVAKHPKDPVSRLRAHVEDTVSFTLGNVELSRSMILAQYDRGGRVTTALRASEANRRDLGAFGLFFTQAKEATRELLDEAIESGLLRDDIDPSLLWGAIWSATQLPLLAWAQGQSDAEEFRAQTLYRVNLVLLAIASDEVRPALVKEMRKLERGLK